MNLGPDRAGRRAAAALVGVGALLAAGLTAVSAPTATAAPTSPRALYIVQLDAPPVAGYDGGLRGYAATAPKRGAKLDLGSTAAQRYAAHLERQQDRALARVAGEEVVYRYDVSLNGFAARMSAADADLLRRSDGVAAVTKNEINKLDTSSTPRFLGLTEPGSLWDQTGGRDGKAGAGTVVGIVDSGIWPESKSFAGSGKPPARFKGDCQAGEQFPNSTCNSKLVVAKYFNSSFPPQDLVKGEYKSPRDGDGHGSHTASTAAGNFGVKAVVDGIDLGTISGMAPGAMIAAYKVCWNGDAGGCGTADSVAAIDAAVADGVDVINYSISGSRTNTFADPVENAFFYAASAGVFVAASAGNSGPGASTVAHNSPWLATVAAGTHDRDSTATVTLGNNATYTGKSITGAAGPAPLVDSTAVGAAGADPRQVELCYPGTLAPAKVAGKIVLCQRGVIARTDKSLAVKQAGGIGMVLYNPEPSSLNADLHSVPTVHVDEVDGAAIKSYIATAGAGATASISASVPGIAAAPEVAAFSSRGPALASGGDLIKPDIMAPGVDILAAVAPPSNAGRSFDYYSGTSMSSPHLAGIGALMASLHPSWSPAAIKSALMTSASQTQNTGAAIPGTPFGFGSGQVAPNSAAAPGLVYDAGREDWRSFAAGAGQCAVCGGPGSATPKDPSDLNYASIAVGSLAGSQTVTRQVTNVSGRQLDLTADVQAPAGVDVVVSPSTLSMGPGDKETFEVTFTRTTADFDTYAFGSLTWAGSGHSVRSPLAVRPVAISAPASVTGTGTAGSTSWKITPGYSGTLATRVDGLVAAAKVTSTHADGNAGSFDEDDPESNLTDPAVQKHVMQVPAGTSYARWATFAADSSAATDDIDLYVYRETTDGLVEVGSSATGSSDETVSKSAPVAGTYRVYVHNWDSDAATNEITLSTWLLDGAAKGNAQVSAPSPVVIATPYDVELTWSGLAGGTRFLGRVVYNDGAADIGSTVVGITTTP